ncbi:hypothetical protein C8A05DRAFT_39940 [Staphylotrichum tortipilum]|uniref:Uncharacterized protein n=1 Tax=Staphylotrichum tortipilum TaxID=2831512 RepID=A0AAN6M8A7_9PEZI|nr:hypothetical protein C8A05DRAFT_39940 [Staphylotrichum longicolle]
MVPTATLPCVKGKRGEVVGYVKVRVWRDEEGERVVEDHHASRWVKRGWVLQERVLSRRMVYFGRWQVYGACAEGMWNEDGTPDLLDNEMVMNGQLVQGFIRDMKLATPLQRFAFGLGSVVERRLMPQYLWQLLISDYSRCELTVPGDKLIAVEGLATAFAQLTGMTYFVGIWLELAWAGLAWKTDRLNSKMVPGRAPSWSWASFDGQFSFQLPEEKTVHPLRASIVTSTNGARVLGLTDVPVVRISSVQTVPDDCHFTQEDLQQGAYPGLDSGFLPEEGSETCTQCKPGQLVHLYARDLLGHMCGLLQLDQEGHPPSDFETLVLFEQERRGVLKRTVLLVQPDGDSPGCFRRIGTGVVYSLPAAFGNPAVGPGQDEITPGQSFQLV